MTVLRRSVLRLPVTARESLDDLAEMASNVLQRKVSRAAVVRAAVKAWLAANEGVDPALLVEAIRVSMVKRGRKARFPANDTPMRRRHRALTP